MVYNPYSDDPKLAEVLAYIEDADDLEIDLIIDSITRRYIIRYPDHDLAFLSLPREPASRKQQLERILDQIKAGQLL